MHSLSLEMDQSVSTNHRLHGLSLSRRGSSAKVSSGISPQQPPPFALTSAPPAGHDGQPRYPEDLYKLLREAAQEKVQKYQTLSLAVARASARALSLSLSPYLSFFLSISHIHIPMHPHALFGSG